MKNRGREHDERELERGRDFFERIIHDAGEFGEENVDEIDKEWAEFESFMRLVALSCFACVKLWLWCQENFIPKRISRSSLVDDLHGNPAASSPRKAQEPNVLPLPGEFLRARPVRILERWGRIGVWPRRLQKHSREQRFRSFYLLSPPGMCLDCMYRSSRWLRLIPRSRFVSFFFRMIRKRSERREKRPLVETKNFSSALPDFSRLFLIYFWFPYVLMKMFLFNILLFVDSYSLQYNKTVVASWFCAERLEIKESKKVLMLSAVVVRLSAKG